MSDGPEWFAPKRYGYGAGLPISWQGWAVTLAYVAVVAGLALTLKQHRLQFVAALVPPTLALIVISGGRPAAAGAGAGAKRIPTSRPRGSAAG